MYGILLAARRKRRTAIAVALVLSLGAYDAVATAQGGKAAPLRIRFEPGRDTAILRGTLAGDAQREYVLGARRNQRLTIGLFTTPPGTLRVEARRAAGGDLVLHGDAAHKWSAVLPEDGDYEIWIKRESRTRRASAYRLTVTIR